ncbi:PorP/SprF family type IX secretion system membrane protein [Mucilaginibacter arboris]|uniref:Type IX secretion system membrane protein PorP/SprF n=1 Tax=Mucilaginibacter arboris TaxID=2682090 RepID=A0A7K1T0R8_9SPHI|nr:PorP/SprF family type IX secretion system membrane protein [Mucilaginibacter arboris]MVN23127.1 type IX secretion system membrane protein PorP/SprF [Mucilaginibacter arboris]
MKKTGILLLLCIFLNHLKTNAQDHMYSEFFNSPLYLNPALTGQMEGDFRMNLIYRNQWASLPGTLSYLTASLDYNVPRFGGGLGLMFTRSAEGSAYLTKNNVSGLYSYSVGSDNFVLSFGLQGGITNRVIDWSKLIFDDQLDQNIGIIPGQSTSAEAPAFNNKYYFDSGAGVSLTLNRLLVGAALQHINRPNESLTGSKAILPMRTDMHISYRLPLDSYGNDDDQDGSYIIPSVVVYNQAKVSSYNAGIQYKRRNINAGLWYRSSGSTGQEAFVLTLIFDLFINREGGEKVRFGVSHDANYSKTNYTNSAGTTEGSIGYETTVPSRDQGSKKFPGARRCYDFY